MVEHSYAGSSGRSVRCPELSKTQPGCWLPTPHPPDLPAAAIVERPHADGVRTFRRVGGLVAKSGEDCIDCLAASLHQTTNNHSHHVCCVHLCSLLMLCSCLAHARYQVTEQVHELVAEPTSCCVRPTSWTESVRSKQPSGPVDPRDATDYITYMSPAYLSGGIYS